MSIMKNLLIIILVVSFTNVYSQVKIEILPEIGKKYFKGVRSNVKLPESINKKPSNPSKCSFFSRYPADRVVIEDERTKGLGLYSNLSINVLFKNNTFVNLKAFKRLTWENDFRRYIHNIPDHGFSASFGYRIKKLDLQTSIILNRYKNYITGGSNPFGYLLKASPFYDISLPSLTARYYLKNGLYLSLEYYYNVRKYYELYVKDPYGVSDWSLQLVLDSNENPKIYEHHLAVSIGWKIFHNWRKGFKKKKEQKPCSVF